MNLTAIRILATIGMLLFLLSLSVGLILASLGFESAPMLWPVWIGGALWIGFGLYAKRLARKEREVHQAIQRAIRLRPVIGSDPAYRRWQKEAE